MILTLLSDLPMLRDLLWQQGQMSEVSVFRNQVTILGLSGLFEQPFGIAAEAKNKLPMLTVKFVARL